MLFFLSVGQLAQRQRQVVAVGLLHLDAHRRVAQRGRQPQQGLLAVAGWGARCRRSVASGPLGSSRVSVSCTRNCHICRLRDPGSGVLHQGAGRAQRGQVLQQGGQLQEHAQAVLGAGADGGRWALGLEAGQLGLPVQRGAAQPGQPAVVKALGLKPSAPMRPRLVCSSEPSRKALMDWRAW